jgi:hypothetical protein
MRSSNSNSPLSEERGLTLPWQGGFLLLGLLLLAVLLARPLWDMDLWWHLASGRHVWQSGGFLAGDPFAYPGVDPPSASRHFLLNAYWLAQVLFYAVQALFGDGGLILLRVGLLLAGPFSIYVWQRRRGVNPAVALVLLLLCGCLTHYFTGERPVLFSFWLFPVLLILLHETGYAGWGQTGHRYRWTIACCLPPLMLVWANLHPGFMLGTVVLAAYLVAEAVTCLAARVSLATAGFKPVAVSVGLAILATLVNPNGFSPYLALVRFEGSLIQGRSSEYVSPLTMLRDYHTSAWPYWLMLAATLPLVLWGWRRLGLTRLGLLALLIYISLQAYRYLPFYLFGSAVLITPILSALIQGRRWLTGCRLAAFACLLTVAVLVVQQRGDGWGQTLQSRVKTANVPAGAVQFIRQQQPAGQLFSHFNWGGYQSWQLAPGYPTLIDGRSLNLPLFKEYTHLLWTEQAMQPIWQKYAIQIMLVPRLKPINGELYQLTVRLARDPEWTLVYVDDVSMLLVRGAANRQLATGYALPKRVIWERVLRDAERNLQHGRSRLFAYRAMSQAYRQLGRFAEAAEISRRLEQIKG